jgi:hypothetical protein
LHALRIQDRSLNVGSDTRDEQHSPAAQATRLELRSAPKPPEFEGFASLQSNTTCCPNQFFDVVLPHFARGVVRLVGYVIYRTFAWSDRDGRPISKQHQVSYRELIEKEGISRGALSVDDHADLSSLGPW